MSSKIKVNVFRQGGRKHFVAEWRDPRTGKLKRKTTGESVRRDAERFSHRLEKDLREGVFEARSVRWSEFRKIFVETQSARWAVTTGKRYATVLDAVERILSPMYASGIDSAAVMAFTAAIARTGIASTTVASMLRHLKATLRWAQRKGYIDKMPDIEMPAQSTRRGGRAIATEEFERMLEAVPKALETRRGPGTTSPFTVADVESWRRMLWLLWNSGLRIGEAYRLDWADPKYIRVLLEGKKPMFEISAKGSKNKKHQKFYMSPECYFWLKETPEAERDGLIVRPTFLGVPCSYGNVVRIVALAGRVATVKVSEDHAGDPVFASAHDLRRSFATRWAAKTSAFVLRSMMRHASVATTAQYYADSEAEPIGEAIWSETRPNPIGTTISTNEEGAETCRKSLPL